MTASGSGWRTADRWQKVYALVLPVGFVVACIGPMLIGLRTLLSVNLLTGFMPWQASSGFDAPGHQYCSTDTIDSSMPGIAYARHAVYSGHLPNWQSLVSGGGPLASVPDLGLLNPLSLPYYLLPLWLAPAFVKLLEFVVAIGGTYLFLRRLGRSQLASSLAGIVFASSGFMVMWTNWPQTRVAALIPALFWSVERLVQRRRLGDAALVALVVASMLFGGFPAVTGFAIYAAAPYLIVRLIARHRRQLRPIATGIGLAVLGLVLGAGLAAVQLLPFTAQLGDTDLSYRVQNSELNLPFSGLLTVVDPSSNGLCINAVMRGKTNPVELIAYVGAVATVLAVFAASLLFWRRGSTRGRSVRSYLVLTTVLVVIAGWVGGPWLALLQHLPVFSNNFIGRIRSLFGFLMAVLAAYGLDAALRPRRGIAPEGVSLRSHRAGSGWQWDRLRRPVAWAWFAATWAGVVVVAIVVLRKAHREALGGTAPVTTWRLVRDTMPIPALLVGLGLLGVILLVWVRNGWLRAAVVAVLPALVVGQAVAFFRGVLPGDNPADFYPVTGTHRFLDANLGDDRYDAAGGTMFPQTSLYYGLRAATGHQFITPGWSDLLLAADPHVRQSPTNYQFSPAITPANVGHSPVLDQLGVKYFVFDPSQLTGSPAYPPAVNGTTTVPAGGTASCTVPAGSLRGVSFVVRNAITASRGSIGITANVAVQAGDTRIESGRFLSTAVRAGAEVTVAVAGEDLPASRPTTVQIRFTGTSGPVQLGTEGGSVACAPVRPVADGLKLVYADSGSIIYQRLTALPRIRWASASTVVTDSAAQVTALQKGLPAGEVLLDEPGPAASGRPATVHVLNDVGGQITASVNAGGSGYLVVADSMQQRGWSVTVDGAAARLVPADHAMAAVAVPAGQHTIRFRYNAPHQKLGLAVTMLSGLLIIALFVADGWLVRRRDATHPVACDDNEPIRITLSENVSDRPNRVDSTTEP